MPHILSPAEYASSENRCDTYLTSDTEQSTSDGPTFPAWHRARRLNGFSNAHSARNSPIQNKLVRNSSVVGIKPRFPEATAGYQIKVDRSY